MIYAAIAVWVFVAGVLTEAPSGPWVRKHVPTKLRVWLAVFWPLLPLYVVYAAGRRVAR